ncbi:hypothetical protein DPEC_G00313010 [Dallia pectoralis]|uniref:Uncharacterized protein n=1 Tax=Dallia pectoralis TaxID=75939 RepID=A0ACC2FC13_DALPE|nr:hypothetical protein DPEC_G00313010 [Dallia pectoralis]
MGRERKCILCQFVYSSKQEMDEHMRSMLHHRELENLKGRDCGHFCQVCLVTMVSLTDYANHISSLVHKQGVETAEREAAGNDQEEEYFDQELVKLVEARRALIRKEEEAATKRAREEELRRREEEERRRKAEEVRSKQEKQFADWNTARQYFRRSGASLDWSYPQKSAPTPAWQVQGGRDESANVHGRPDPWQNLDMRSNWHYSKQGRNATWHGQEPPKFSRWPPGERSGPHARDDWPNNNKWGREGFPAQQRGGRGPWQQSSRAGKGLPGILPDPVMMEGLSNTESPHLMDFTKDPPLPDSFFGQHPIGAPFNPQDEDRKDGQRNPNRGTPGGAAAEHDRDHGLGHKAFSSNPKMDKVHRWSPYPTLSHKDPHPNASEKIPKDPHPNTSEKIPKDPHPNTSEKIPKDSHPNISEKIPKVPHPNTSEKIPKDPHPNTSERLPKGPPSLPILQTQTPQNLPTKYCEVDRKPRCDVALVPSVSRSSGPKPISAHAGQQMRAPDHCAEGTDLVRNGSSRCLSSSKANIVRKDNKTSNIAAGSNFTCQRAAKLESLEKGPSNPTATTFKAHLNLSPTTKTQASSASSPSTTPRSQLSRTSSQDSDQPMSSRHSSQDLVRRVGSKSTTPQQGQEKQLTVMLSKAKETLLDKRTSVDLSGKHRRRMKEKEVAKEEAVSKSQESNSQEMEVTTVSNSQEMEVNTVSNSQEWVLHIDEEQQMESSEDAMLAANCKAKKDQLTRRVRVTRSTRADRTEIATTRSTRSSPKEKGTTRSTRADPVEERTPRSTRSDPTEKGTARSARADPVEERTTRSTRSDQVGERTPRSTRADPVEERTPRSTSADPVGERTPRSTIADPFEERTPRSTRSDPVGLRTLRSTRSSPTEKGTTRSTRPDPVEESTPRSTRSDPTEKGTPRSIRSDTTEKGTPRSIRSDTTEKGTARSARADPVEEITPRSTGADQVEESTLRSCSAAADQMETMTESGTSAPNNFMSLQSVQVSTSTMESPVGAMLPPSAREELEKRERQRGLVAGSGVEAMKISNARQGSDSDHCRSSHPTPGPHTIFEPSSGSILPNTLSKVSLPPALKKDLSKHVGLKTKMGNHEPNLNIARRIRNISETRRGEVEKDSGLKPTLRQLISSSGSRRCVNWDQVYQEVHRKKQEQGKGLPRFGIEMVSFYQEELSHEDENIPLAEGFQWETLFNFSDSEPAVATATPRKRSLSESSVAPDRSTANLSSLFEGLIRSQGHTSPEERSTVDGPERMRRRCSEQPSSVSLGDLLQPKVEGTQCGARAQRKAKKTPAEGPPGALVQPEADSVIGDISSGNEHNDTLGAGKKRRAAGDVPCPDIPSSERKNKRMKVKSKKERLQVDQLLAVSLREDELCRSLQGIDNSLIQARTALQAAYLEVQRLLVVKQQVSTEMNTLRSKRIELLQGMQGGFERPAMDQPRVKSCEEEMPLENPPLAHSNAPCPNHPSQSPAPLVPQRGSTPPSLSPGHHAQPQAVSPVVVIKAEPLWPVIVSTESLSAESVVHQGAHSTTPEPTPTAPQTGSAPSFLTDAGRTSHHRATVAPSEEESSLAVGDPDDSGSSDEVQVVERGVQVRRGDLRDTKPPQAILVDPSTCRTTDPVTTSVLPPSLHPPAEVKTVKRVRKLKKKRVLRKAQGKEEQPDNSDTELEAEAASSRPVRHQRSRRKAGGSSPPQVTTSFSTPLGVAEDGGEVRAGSPGPLGSPAARREAKQEDSDSSLEMVELPRRLLWRWSTSTPLTRRRRRTWSGMDVSAAINICDRDVQLPLFSAKQSKTSSDVSSEPGEQEQPSEGAFEGHQEAVNAMQVHMGLLYTCSGDRTVRAFNLVTRKCVAVFEGHSTKVNCLLVSSGAGLQHRLYSGSSDQTIRCYSLRTKECVDQFSLPDRVLCIHNRWKVLYAGLANGSVVTFSLKTNKQLDVFDCHGPRAVSCLSTAQEGARRILLVGSYDSTISVRDAKSGLLLRSLEGHSKTVLCMKVVNDLVFSGSSDQLVHAHNIHTGELVRVYKGHSHAVTVVAVLGKVMVTACLDKLVRVYELQTHDRLQVYGGHTDMVMCMVIHKSMVYTGCYDGSVQAVKLNLIQNHRCWWHGCSLIFGVLAHLQQHLLQDHASPNTQTFKCRWKNCNEFFASRNGSKQGAPKHMLKHAEEEQTS